MSTQLEAVKKEYAVQTYETPASMEPWLNQQLMDHIYRVASILAKSKVIPEHYRNNEAECFIGVQLACAMGLSPMQVLQKTYVIQGKPGVEAQLVIAAINISGKFEGNLNFEMQYDDKGKAFGCVAFAIAKSDGIRREALCNMDMVRAERWDQKGGSKWKTMAEQMLKYRAATFFCRTHCPEVMMGYSEKQELIDEFGEDENKRDNVRVQGQTATQALTSRLKEEEEGMTIIEGKPVSGTEFVSSDVAAAEAAKVLEAAAAKKEKNRVNRAAAKAAKAKKAKEAEEAKPEVKEDTTPFDNCVNSMIHRLDCLPHAAEAAIDGYCMAHGVGRSVSAGFDGAFAVAVDKAVVDGMITI